MNVAIGSDHAGWELKEAIKELLDKMNVTYHDFGPMNNDPVDYPEYAVQVARSISNDKYSLGILVCGSGIGVDIVANKIPGIRSALCWTEEMAEMSREHNNANVLSLGARFIDKDTALRMVDKFLYTNFEAGGRHERRVRQIHDLTQR